MEEWNNEKNVDRFNDKCNGFRSFSSGSSANPTSSLIRYKKGLLGLFLLAIYLGIKTKTQAELLYSNFFTISWENINDVFSPPYS
jgi:hypothetical protein